MKTFRKLCTGAVGAIVGVGSLVALPLAAAGPAAAGEPTCTPTAGYTNCQTFAYTGSDQTFTVPAGVTSLRAHVFGAGGGGSNASTAGNYAGAGGSGAFLAGTVPVTPGQTLSLTVGEGGHTSGSAGFGGGAAAGSGTGLGGGGAASGGGLSAVWSGTNHTTPLLVAGGGGGAGSSSFLSGLGLGIGVHLGYLIGGGGAGIQTGQPGNGGAGYAGGGGSQNAGGLIGSILDSACLSSPAPGTQYAGGAGKSAPVLGSLLFGEGGGGGGGYFGGGGGACALLSAVVLSSGQGGGGGGGSSYLAPSVADTTTQTGATSTSTLSVTLGGGQADLLRLNANIGNGVSGTNSSGNGGNGEVALEWVGPPSPTHATSSGTGTAGQSPTISVPTGGTLRLLNGSTPVTTLTVAGEGTYTVNTTTNIITFVPVAGFSGDATPVGFRVTDAHGQSADNTYTPHVNKPAAPTPPALSGSGTGTAGSSATVAIPSGGSVTLLNGSTPTNTVTISGQGTYTLDPSTGIITFVPVLGFSGDADPVHYQVTDVYGSTGTSTFTAHADAPAAPNPGPLTSVGIGTAAQHATAVVPTGGSAALVDPNNSSNTLLLTVTGEGVYSIIASSGVITFSPAIGFTGDATAIHYRVTDAYGNSGTSTYRPHVNPVSGPATPAPIVSSGSGTGPQTGTVTIPSGGSVTLLNGSTHTNTVTIPNQGVYTLDPSTGIITFTPIPGFVGDSTPVIFQITDSNGNTATSTFTAHVNRPPAPTPAAANSTGAGTAPQTATVAIPAGGGISLLDVDNNPVNTVVVPGQGTYSLDPQTGIITFTPVLGFSGHASGVHFQVTDAYGSTGTGLYAPVVGLPPAPQVPSDPHSAVAKNTTGSLTVAIPEGGSVQLVAGSSPTTYVNSQGNTWTLNQTSHVITFTPFHDLVGDAGVATYRVMDAYGQWTDGTYSVTVTGTSAPAPPTPTQPTPVAKVSSPALTKIVTAGGKIPVTCSLTIRAIGRCDVTLIYRNTRGTYVVGTGSFVSKGKGTAGHVVVPVAMTPVGRIGATALGGVVSIASVKIIPYGSRSAYSPSGIVRFVDYRVTDSVYFDEGTPALRSVEVAHLNKLRTQLAKVQSLTCTGNTDPQANTTNDYLLAKARAQAVCDYVTRGTSIKKTVVSNGANRPIASNATPQGQQGNRRTDLRFDY